MEEEAWGEGGGGWEARDCPGRDPADAGTAGHAQGRERAPHIDSQIPTERDRKLANQINVAANNNNQPHRTANLLQRTNTNPTFSPNQITVITKIPTF